MLSLTCLVLFLSSFSQFFDLWMCNPRLEDYGRLSIISRFWTFNWFVSTLVLGVYVFLYFGRDKLFSGQIILSITFLIICCAMLAMVNGKKEQALHLHNSLRYPKV